MSALRNDLIEWLLAGEPWVQYRTRIDLMSQPEDAPDVLAARQAMLVHPRVRALLDELAAWPGPPLKRHNDAGHLLHKLTFVADLGLRADDPGVGVVVERILAHQSPEGMFQVTMNIHPRYGGAGEDQLLWMLCDAPSILYALLKLGLAGDDRVQAAAQHLVSLIHENGWPCRAAPEAGKFKGPGRKSDPCPYANLVSLKTLAQVADWRDGEPSRIGAETLLALWAQRREQRPFLFAMGTHFIQLKAPLIWYDILHVLDVLTQFPWLRGDSRLQEMLALLASKADEKGRSAAESVWMAWKEWDFGQKREPSRWVTFLAHRIAARMAV